MAGQLVDPLQLLIDSGRELEGISCLKRVLEGCQLFGVSLSGLHDPFERGTRRVIAANKSRAYTDLASQLHGGLEQILEDPKLIIELVGGLLGLCGVVAIPAHKLSDMGPVFLLDVRVVIFFVGTRAGELNGVASWALLTEGKKAVVDKLTAVVGVDPLEGKRKLVFDLGDRIQDTQSALTHDGLRSTQQVAMSTQSRLWTNSPTAEAPECDTRSISR